MATYRDESILKIASRDDIVPGYHTFVVNDVNYSTQVIVLNGDQTLINDPVWGDTTYDQTMLVVIINGNLFINSGVLVTPQVRKKGFFLYVKGTLTNYGCISMTERGAHAVGQNVYLFKNKDDSYEYVPAAGGAGGSGGGNGTNDFNQGGFPGESGTNRRTGGGQGGMGASAIGGNGSAGTSYSGGTGGGAAAWHVIGGHGQSNGGRGGDAVRNMAHITGAGVGNPGGTAYGVESMSGTGGLLIIYTRILSNYNTIEANGTSAPSIGWVGGGSGAGSINIFYIKEQRRGTINARGGGDAGDGSITLTKLSTQLYLIDYLNKLNYFENDELHELDSTIDLLSLQEFLIFGSTVLELAQPFFNDTLSLLVCTQEERLKYKLVATDQPIINTESITFNMGMWIYKMQLVATLNSNIVKIIFCTNDRWFWLVSGEWQETDLDNFNINIGNTIAQVNAFTELNWKKFNMLDNQDMDPFYKQNIKIAILLSHNMYDTTPIINKINVWCYFPTEALGISTNKYILTHYYDKYEVKWNNNTTSSIMIFYESR